MRAAAALAWVAPGLQTAAARLRGSRLLPFQYSTPAADCIFLSASLLTQHKMPTPRAPRRLLPYLREKGLGVINASVLSMGLLTHQVRSAASQPAQCGYCHQTSNAVAQNHVARPLHCCAPVWQCSLAHGKYWMLSCRT